MYDQHGMWALGCVDSDELELERLKGWNEEIELEMEQRIAELDQIRGNLIVDPEDIEQLQEARPASFVVEPPTPTGLRC